MAFIKRRILAAFLLVLAACSVSAHPAQIGLESSEPGPCAVKLPEDPGELHPKRLNQSRKVIHDRAEYNAYMAALKLPDPRQKATAMEEFATRYPHSASMKDALAQAMAAYQASGNTAKVGETATRLLQLQLDLRPLSIIVFLARDCATKGTTVYAQSIGKQLLQLSQRGLAALPEWQETQGASLPEGAKLRDQMTAIFAGAAGWGALQNRDYAVARQFYEKALAIDPQNVQNLYQLAVTDLDMTPIDPNGFWYCGKAVSIARNSATVTMSPYCKFKFKQHGGKPEEWDRLVSNTEKDTAPPSDFAKNLSLHEPNPDLQDATRTPGVVAPLPPSEKGDPISRLIPSTNKSSRVGAGIGSSSVLVTPETEAGVSPPIPTYLNRPLYPKSDLDAKITRVEKLEIAIDVDGNVHDVSVINSLGPEFDREAIAAAKQWKFNPATKDGKPVTSKELVLINFYPGMPGQPTMQTH